MKERENKMKFVINNCFGGYELSQDFLDKYGKKFEYLERNDPELGSAVEEFGEAESSGFFASLHIMDIPDDCTDYYIDEYDGRENIIYVKDGKLHWA